MVNVPPVQGFVGIDSYKIHCIIGNNPHERVQEQDIFVDMRVALDISKCLQSDQLKDTVDYSALAEVCKGLATSRQYRLLETMAAEVLKRCLQDFAIDWAWIRIKKPAALPSAQYTYVELELYREQI